MKDNKSFIDFMGETKELNRWAVMRIGLTGGFMGAILTVAFMWIATII